MKFASCAKWILSGEHSVTRGGKAIAFPLKKYTCTVDYKESDSLSVIYKNMDSSYKDVFIELLKEASIFSNINFEDISGNFSVINEIQMQSGLGSSAAICTNIANIFKYLGFGKNPFALAKHLENKFHINSSGLDIAVSITGKPLIFQNNKVKYVLENSFWPNLVLTYSGQSSMTSECVDIVKRIWCKNNAQARELDSMMNYASDLCESAFKKSNFEELKNGIKTGYEVFKGWGLCNDALSEHINSLIQSGAVAAKPIGSGLGGYVVSLWEEKPKKYE